MGPNEVTQEQLEQLEPVEGSAKITSHKSPGRVAAGKKLAELNRKNKAKKQQPDEPSSVDLSLVIGAFGVFIGLGGLYLQYRSDKVKPIEKTKAKEPVEKVSTLPTMD